MTSICDLLRIFILLLGSAFIVSLVRSQNTTSSNGESLCITSAGQFGKCTRFLGCKTRRWMKPGRPDICFNENGASIICCPTELNPRRSKNVPVCGLSLAPNSTSRSKRQTRLDSEGTTDETGDPEGFIVGGRNAVLGQYPWMGILFSENDVDRKLNLCGATLISLDAVLTAAHCVHDKDHKFVVRFGEHTMSVNEDGAKLVEVRVKDIKIHEDYKPPALYNDVAVLRLERRVPLSSKILPICLPHDLGDKTFVGEKAIAAGWGAIETSGPNADTLQEVDLPVVTNDHCNTAYADQTIQTTLPNGITTNIICAGNGKEAKDACQGDSGGPLMVFESSISRWIQVGIVCAGLYCDGGFPGIYTRVTMYVDWIMKAMV